LKKIVNYSIFADYIYIENQSLFLDLKRIMLTLKILFFPRSTQGFSEEAVGLMKVKPKKGDLTT